MLFCQLKCMFAIAYSLLMTNYFHDKKNFFS